MTAWTTIALAALLGLTAAGINPALVHTPWSGLDSAFGVAHPLCLVTLALTLLLAAVPVELKLGRLPLLAAWGLPCIGSFWLYQRAWPEVAAASLLITLWVVSWKRKDKMPWRLWVPLWVAEGLALFLAGSPPGAMLLALGVGLGVGLYAKSEAVAILGLASGGALLLAWLS